MFTGSEIAIPPRFSVAFVVALMLASVAGCGQFESGGGSRTFHVAGKRGLAVFGTSSGRKLAFVIFVNAGSDSAHASGGSSWSGDIKLPVGRSVAYRGRSDGIEIGGSSYTFADGKVFLLSWTDEVPVVQQLDVPMNEAAYAVEIDRLAKTAEIKTLMDE